MVVKKSDLSQGKVIKFPEENVDFYWFSQYIGEWKMGDRHGQGIMRYSEKERYEGQWQNDVRSGTGNMYYEDGSYYDGEWLKDERNGVGFYQLANLDCYLGEFQNDRKNGTGTYFYLLIGQLLTGTWLNDVAKCGYMRDINGYGKIDVCTKPTKYPIPELYLKDYRKLLKSLSIMYYKIINKNSQSPLTGKMKNKLFEFQMCIESSEEELEKLEQNLTQLTDGKSIKDYYEELEDPVAVMDGHKQIMNLLYLDPKPIGEE